MISLLTFIQTGRLGEIGLGSTRDEVELAFGPPDEWDTRFHFPLSPVWRYGNIEFHFDYEKLCLVSCELFDTPHMGTIPCDAWKLRRGVRKEDITSWLEEANIPFKKGWGNVEINNDEGSWWITLAQGRVTLCFDDDEGGECLSAFWCR